MKGKGKWIILGSIAILAVIGIGMVYSQNKRKENTLHGSFTINGQEYVMGKGKSISLKLLDYTDEAETEEGTWRGKQYEDMEAMERELGIKLLKVPLPFKLISREEGKNYCLQILNEERAMIFYFLTEVPESKVNMPDMINVQFALAGGSKVGEIAFEDEVFEDKWKSEGGDEQMTTMDSKYELMSTYESSKLETTVFIVKNASVSITKTSDSELAPINDESYYVQFLYEGIMYQLQWNEKIEQEEMREFVEMLKL
ncbi:MAG: hypothetical protein NC412_00615 [Roseburia sp.]|nr:hypothetical protein [Roseburia sp.]MCM1277703.1 hypothetical protein [Robinsoniella sp.]